MRSADRLRLAFVAGTLGQGGAEKQLVYMARALHDTGADVRVYSLTRGEHFEAALCDIGLVPVWIGRLRPPPMRVLALTAALRDFRPHILQSAHFYTNLYVRLVAPLYGALDIGAARGDVVHEVLSNGRAGRWLLRAPSAMIVNSCAAKRNTSAYGLSPEAVHVLPNVIDLDAFDAAGNVVGGSGNEIVVAGVGTMIRLKRFDRFLRAIAAARKRGLPVRGMLIGDGQERAALEAHARDLGLLPNGITFAGRLNDIPAALRGADVLMLTSDHEGFPNVLLEGMSASLPVVSTAAGDAEAIVAHGVSGFVVRLDAEDALVDYLCELAASRDLREQMGRAGRVRVEQQYAYAGLAARLTAIYRTVAEHQGHQATLAALGC